MSDTPSADEHKSEDGASVPDDRCLPGDPVLDTLRARLPEGYALDGLMIYRLLSAGRAQPLCGPVLVRSQARARDGSGWALDIAFRTFDGSWQAVVLPMRDLLKSPARVVADLVDRGFDLRGRPQDVCDLLRGMQVDQIALAVDAMGWVDEAWTTFVTPAGAILTRSDAAADQSVLFTGTPRVTLPPIPDTARAISAEAWGADVVGKSPGDAVTLGLGAAMAPVLMPIIEAPSFLVHLHSNDGAGRLCRAVASSVWAPPGQTPLTWSDPLPRLLTEIRAARDGLVILSGFEPRHLRKLPALAEAMAALDAAGRGRVVILSTGLQPLVGGDGRAPAGQDLRNIIDIDARAWLTPGAEEIMAAAARHAATFGPELTQRLIDWKVGSRDVYMRAHCEEVGDAISGRDDLPLDAQTARVAMACGMMYTALDCAVRRDLVPAQPRDQAKGFFVQLAQSWITRHRGVLTTQDRKFISHTATRIRDMLRENTLAPLSPADGIVQASDNGWQDDAYVYLTGQTLADIAQSAGAPLDRLIELLVAQDLLLHGRERGYKFKLPSRVPGRPRAYRLTREILRYAAARDGA
jgi:hypothetical protein